MLRFSVPAMLLALGCVVMPADLSSQQRPTPEQAELLLRTRPELVQQLRDRIIRSGMTNAEVRARLRTEGYPENLLDAYLPPDGERGHVTTSTDVLDATRSLAVDPTVPDTASPFSFLGLDGRVLSRPVPMAVTPSDEPDVQLGDKMRIFGMEVFRRKTSQFDPNLAGPVDASYRVGPGDRLVLILTGDVEAAYTLDVTREGFVVVPQVGRIDVANLTLGQIEDLFYQRLGRAYSGIRRQNATTRFSVSPVSLRSNQIYVIGDVLLPGSYRVSGAGTVLTALYAAGGPTATGTMRSVEVRRAGRTLPTLDIYEYLLQGSATRDVRLENGDVVFVGVHGPRVQISGEIVRPATYELTRNETLADLVRYAGGLRPTASLRRIQIERLDPARASDPAGRERFVLDVPLQPEAGSVVPPVTLENGDIVRVFRITNPVRASVEVKGNVWAPGRVALTPGMQISDALRSAGGVKPDVYLGQIVIDRLQSDSTRIRVYSAFADTLGNVAQDLALRENDIIEVFSVTEFRQQRYVTIQGAVRKPGQYPFRENMTMRDLVLQAGGLHERALLTQAEIASMPENRNDGKMAVTRRVPLDSSYLFERAPDGKYLGPPGIPAASSSAPEVELEAYDNVLILEQPDWDLPRFVTVSGEVKYPGTYTIISRDEKLRDILARAGGLTSVAYAAGVSFTRTAGDIGRIGVDLSRVLQDPRFRDNLLLENGDSIFIPAYKPTVVVTGAVNSPVAVSWVPGRNIDWYIRAAGGASVTGDPNHAWVVQPNGIVESSRTRALLPDSKPEPQPGGTVTVPERDPNRKTDRLAVIGSITQIVASLVAIVAIAR